MACMRYAFEYGDLNGVKWMQGLHNPGDALTKPRTVLTGRLNKTFAGGVLDESIGNEEMEL